MGSSSNQRGRYWGRVGGAVGGIFLTFLLVLLAWSEEVPLVSSALDMFSEVFDGLAGFFVFVGMFMIVGLLIGDQLAKKLKK